MKELYLNNTRVDFDDDFQLTLESNLFKSVDSLTANHSSTIKLPASDRNKAFFAQFQLPAMRGANLRQWLRCDYRKDGVTIVEDGRAVLLSASGDGYEISVVWDLSALSKIKDEGLKLPQLPSAGEVLTLQARNDLSGRGFNTYGFSDLSTGWAGNAKTPSLLPVVRVKWVLEKICSHYGLTITTDEGRQNRLHLLTMPLTSMRRYYARDDHSTQQFKITYYYAELYSGYYYAGAGEMNGLLEPYAMEAPGVKLYYGLRATGDVTLHVTDWNCNVEAYVGSPSITYDSYAKEYLVAMSAGEAIRLTPYNRTERDELVVNGWYESTAELHVGDKYPIVENLPEITCMEFLKEICAQLGVWIFQRDASTIELVSLDTFMEDNAMQSVKALSVESISPRRDGWAQRNVLKYATDDNVPSDFRGVITVNDATLDAEATLFESKFVGMAGNILPLWETETDTDGNVTAKLRNLAPRLGVEVGTLKSKINGVTWTQIVDYYYRTYQAIATEPKVVTVQALLRPSQVKSLQLDAPIISPLVEVPGLILDAKSANGDVYNLKTILFRPSYVFAPSYVPTDLVLHLDGLDRGDVDGKWVDVEAGEVFNLLYSFTEQPDGVYFGTNGLGKSVNPLTYLSSECTAEVVFNDNHRSGTRILLAGNNNNVAIGYLNGATLIKTMSPTVMPTYKYTPPAGAHTLTVTPTNAYLDGVALEPTGAKNNWSTPSATSGLILGARASGNNFNGIIHGVRIYSRELTEREIKQNYFVDKQRYG